MVTRVDFEDSGRLDFGVAIGRSLSETGFFILENAPIDQDLVQRAYAVSAEFFALSESVKHSYCLPELHGQRGFTPFGQEHAKDSPHGDLKEFWHVGNSTLRQNLIPTELPEFSRVLNELYGQLEACGQVILGAIADFLQEPLSAIYQPGGDSILRVIHYPPMSEIGAETAPPLSLRAAAHEDINLITLLPTATASGLEILHEGRWLAIEAPPGSLIVDSGDMLQWRTNGRLKSTTHRVVNPDNSRDRRFSMPFFVHPHPKMDLTPLASCVVDGKSKFPPIDAGTYLQRRLAEIGLVK
jgi:isopenicillin N synthase-like dioxygenase